MNSVITLRIIIKTLRILYIQKMVRKYIIPIYYKVNIKKIPWILNRILDSKLFII